MLKTMYVWFLFKQSLRLIKSGQWKDLKHHIPNISVIKQRKKNWLSIYLSYIDLWYLFSWPSNRGLRPRSIRWCVTSEDQKGAFSPQFGPKTVEAGTRPVHRLSTVFEQCSSREVTPTCFTKKAVIELLTLDWESFLKQTHTENP